MAYICKSYLQLIFAAGICNHVVQVTTWEPSSVLTWPWRTCRPPSRTPGSSPSPSGATGWGSSHWANWGEWVRTSSYIYLKLDFLWSSIFLSPIIWSGAWSLEISRNKLHSLPSLAFSGRFVLCCSLAKYKYKYRYKYKFKFKFQVALPSQASSAVSGTSRFHKTSSQGVAMMMIMMMIMMMMTMMMIEHELCLSHFYLLNSGFLLIPYPVWRSWTSWTYQVRAQHTSKTNNLNHEKLDP